MSALGFIGGLGALATGFQKGYEQSEDREQLKADREFQRQQRTYEQGQQQRKIDEQTRTDQRAAADAAVPDTESVETDLNAKNPVTSQITVDNDGNPSATQLPVLVTETRKRTFASMARDYAENAKKAQDINAYTDWTKKADKMDFDQSARDFTAWSARAAGAPIDKAAESFAQIYSSDPFAGKATVVKSSNGSSVAQDGSVTIEFVNKNSGQKVEHSFKSVGDMVRMGRAYFSPDTYNKLVEKQAEIDAEIAKNPYHNATPGTVTLDKRTGKPVFTNITDRVQIGEDGSGNPIYGKPATGGRGAGTSAGAGGKAPKEFIDKATELLDKNMPKADSPEASEQRSTAILHVTRLHEINPEMRPETAQFIARDAVMNPTRMTLQLNNATGDFSSFYSNPSVDRGRKYEIGVGAGSVDEAIKVHGEAKVAGAVNGMINGLAAGQPADKRQAWIAATRDASQNPEMVEAIVAKAVADGKDGDVVRRQLDLIGRFTAAQKKPGDAGPAFTQEQKDAARKYGYDADAPSVGTRLAAGARGMFRAVASAAAPSESYVRSTLQKVNATGKIEQGDAVALAQAIEANPGLKDLLTPEQQNAVRVISGRKF